MSSENIKKSSLNNIYEKISSVVPEIEWKIHAPLIEKINKLKKEKNAVILAHNYQTPEIYHGVADISSDSLALAIEASKTQANMLISSLMPGNRTPLLSLIFMVRPERLELSLANPTWPSTKPVYQFQHSRDIF